MQLTSILKTRAAYWANPQVTTSIDCKEQDLGGCNYPQLAAIEKYILKNIFISIIKEQCSDQRESKWKHLNAS